MRRRRYQNGSLFKEKRKSGPDVWAFRYRDGQVNRKEIIGTVEQFKTKSEAQKTCESLRVNVNREARSPRTISELVAHYQQRELLNKTPYTQEVYNGYFKTWILPKWKDFRLSDIHAVAVETWLGTLPLAPGTRSKLRNLMHTIFNMRCVGSSSTATRSRWCASRPSAFRLPMC